MEALREQGKRGRLLKRLVLASVESYIGRGQLGMAERWLEELVGPATESALDINDQLLRVRTLVARARIAYHAVHLRRLLRS